MPGVQNSELRTQNLERPDLRAGYRRVEGFSRFPHQRSVMLGIGMSHLQ